MPAWTILVAYQIAWLGCVGGGARGMTWPALAGAALVLACAAAQRGPRAPRLAFALAWALVGAGCDAILAAVGWISFPIPSASLGPLPLWMALLWLSFAPCLPLLARWLGSRLLLAAALGAAGGPLAWLGAAGLGAAEIGGAAGWIAIALEYALIVPLAVRAAARFSASS